MHVLDMHICMCMCMRMFMYVCCAGGAATTGGAAAAVVWKAQVTDIYFVCPIFENV